MTIKQSTLRLVSRLLWHAGATRSITNMASRCRLEKLRLRGASIFRLRKRSSNTFQILVYHRITAYDDPFYAGVPVDSLRRQIKALQKSWTIMDLWDLVSKVRAQEPIPPNAVALTFDDGYRDNYELAFPVLQKYQVPATIFLTTSFIDQEDVPWNDRVTFALKHTDFSKLEFAHQDRKFAFHLNSEANRLIARDKILWVLRHIPHEDKLSLVESITGSLKVVDFNYLWKSMLTWDQVKEMHRRGISFGAHTVTHPILTRLPLDQARDEIEGSKRRIESVLDTSVPLFAYPAGTHADFNDSIREAVRRGGFGGAVTTIFGSNSLETDPYSLRRGGSAEQDETLFALQQAYYKLTN